MRQVADRAGLFLFLSSVVALLMGVLLLPAFDKADVPAVLLLGIVCGAIGTIVCAASEEPKGFIWMGKQESSSAHPPTADAYGLNSTPELPE